MGTYQTYYQYSLLSKVSRTYHYFDIMVLSLSMIHVPRAPDTFLKRYYYDFPKEIYSV
jgi:hypothetical protein